MRVIEESDPINFWLAYSDLFSGVLVLVLGLLLLQLYPQGNEDQELKTRREAQWELTRKLFEEIKLKGYSTTEDSVDALHNRFNDRDSKLKDLVSFRDAEGDEAIVIYRPEGEEQRFTFGSKVLFENNGPFLKEIKPNGLELLRSIGPILLLAGASNSEIRVIGHTDVKPPRSTVGMEYNWILSAERAIALVTVLLSDPVIGERLPKESKDTYMQFKREEITFNIPPNRISALGRGEFEPIGSDPGDSWNERRKRIYQSWDNESEMTNNRRIEVIVRYVPARN